MKFGRMKDIIMTQHTLKFYEWESFVGSLHS